MKGLEITVTPLSSVNLGDRSDAEYFSKENLRIQRALEEHHSVPLGKLTSITASAFYPAATDLYAAGDIPFARCVDCVNYPIISRQQDAEFERIPEWFVRDSGQIRTVGRGDIIITKVGTPCYASIVHEHDEIALSRTVLGLTKIEGVDPYYLTAFLRSHYGFTPLQRQRELTIQYQLTLERVRDVLVFEPSGVLQKAVAAQMRAHILKQNEAGQLLVDAEQALLRALGLINWQPPEPLTYTRPASEVGAAHRIDAEYFAPRVADLLKHLGLGGQAVRDVAPARCEYFVPGGPGEFDYLEIGALHSDGTVTGDRVLKADAPSRATWHVRAGDVVTSTVRPLRRLSAIIAPEQDGFVASSGFLVLQPQDVPSEVLLTFLRLPPVCELMDLHTSASLYPTISERDLLNLPFPKLPAKTCDAIVPAVRSAHAARREAQAMLARAQHAVELAIEQDEKAALAYLGG